MLSKTISQRVATGLDELAAMLFESRVNELRAERA